MQYLCSSLSALFRCTKVAKHSFYSIGTKTMFGSVLEHNANLHHVKRCKTCVSGLNAILWCTKVVKHPFYSIGAKIMFGCVLELFDNIRHAKDAKLVFEPECTISGYQSCEVSILLHWTQNDVWECFGAFCYPLARKYAKLVVEPEYTILGYQSWEACILLHWNWNDVWECFGAFRKPSVCKRCKTCVSRLNALFQVPKLWSIHFTPLGQNWCLCVSGHIAKLWHVKDAKLVIELECTISGYQSCEAFILLDWNQDNVWECFGAVR
jgi:hypothetical protein